VRTIFENRNIYDGSKGAVDIVWIRIMTIAGARKLHHSEESYVKFYYMCQFYPTHITLHICFITHLKVKLKKNYWIRSYYE